MKRNIDNDINLKEKILEEGSMPLVNSRAMTRSIYNGALLNIVPLNFNYIHQGKSLVYSDPCVDPTRRGLFYGPGYNFVLSFARYLRGLDSNYVNSFEYIINNDIDMLTKLLRYSLPMRYNDYFDEQGNQTTYLNELATELQKYRLNGTYLINTCTEYSWNVSLPLFRLANGDKFVLIDGFNKNGSVYSPNGGNFGTILDNSEAFVSVVNPIINQNNDTFYVYRVDSNDDGSYQAKLVAGGIKYNVTNINHNGLQTYMRITLDIPQVLCSFSDDTELVSNCRTTNQTYNTDIMILNAKNFIKAALKNYFFESRGNNLYGLYVSLLDLIDIGPLVVKNYDNPSKYTDAIINIFDKQVTPILLDYFNLQDANLLYDHINNILDKFIEHYGSDYSGIEASTDWDELRNELVLSAEAIYVACFTLFSTLVHSENFSDAQKSIFVNLRDPRGFPGTFYRNKCALSGLGNIVQVAKSCRLKYISNNQNNAVGYDLSRNFKFSSDNIKYNRGSNDANVNVYQSDYSTIVLSEGYVINAQEVDGDDISFNVSVTNFF